MQLFIVALAASCAAAAVRGQSGAAVPPRDAAEELSRFKQFVTDNSLPEMGPQLGSCHYDCRVAEFLLLRPEGGRRVFQHQGVGGAIALDLNFQSLGRDRARIHYRLAEQIEGLEVLFADGKLGDATARPAGHTPADELTSDVDDGRIPSHFNARVAQAAAGKHYVLAGSMSEGGLWKKAPGQDAVRVTSGEGMYANPIVTPDGVWAVAARAEAQSHWGKPNDVVRFNLTTGQEYRVALPPAGQFEPVAYVAPHGRVLLRRARDENSRSESAGPAAPEFYLLDAQTGRTELVSGVFEPLMRQGDRPLQPTGRPDEFWAALPDRQKNETRVGRYSLKDFSFKTALVVPHLAFDGMSAWADEAAGKLYVVYEGQLPRLPLQGPPAAGGAKDE